MCKEIRGKAGQCAVGVVVVGVGLPAGEVQVGTDLDVVQCCWCCLVLMGKFPCYKCVQQHFAPFSTFFNIFGFSTVENWPFSTFQHSSPPH